MLVRMNHPSARRAMHDARHRVRPLPDTTKPNADPTGTADIRRRFSAMTDIRWRKMRAQLQMTIVQQDMLGLDNITQTPLSTALSTLGADGKIRAFQNWLDATLQRVTLENDTAYLDPMVAAAYNRAVARAMRLAKSTAQPQNATQAIASLQQLVMVEMQGINEAFSQRVVRLVSNALIERTAAGALFKAAAQAIEQVGVTRSRALVETYTVKANATGTLDEFEAAGIAKVGVIPELAPPKKVTKDFNPYHDPKSGEFTSSEISAGLPSWLHAGEGWQDPTHPRVKYGVETWNKLLAAAGGDPVEAARIERTLRKRAEAAALTHAGGLSPDALFVDELQKFIDAPGPAGTGPGARIFNVPVPSVSTIGRIRAAQVNVENLGEVDILTAGDADVCEICQDLEDGGPYSINEARSLIPAHPWCRCAFVPSVDAAFAAEQ